MAVAAATAATMAKAAVVERVVFALNGRRYEVAGADPSTRLLEFIRTQTPFKGTKLGCGEVITTEGLGNTRDGFHAVQKRMSGFHASQCGFCTPGMCMSIFTSLINADKSKGPEPPKGFSKLKVSEAEKAFSACKEGWYHPRSIKEYYELINSCVLSDSVKVIIGNTSSGIPGYKDEDLYKHAIRVKKVEKFLTDTDYASNMPWPSRRETISNSDYKPVGDPIKKYGVELQASGEAVYVDDIPAPKNCLYGEFIYSTKPLAYVKSIKFKSSLASEKIIDVVSAKDIPSGGENIGSSFIFGDESLFGYPIAEYAGQALGIVIAETQRYADMAAKQVIVEYDTEGLSPPILTVEQAVENSSYFNVPSEYYPNEVGDVSKGMAEADHKIPAAEVKFASEYYFYMEPQTALAIPDEDNTLIVYSSSQYPEFAQSVIARCLGIPLSNLYELVRPN
nr:unnamed protein product [Digitaria exilis]